MARDIAAFTAKQFNGQLALLKTALSEGCSADAHPHAVLLGGQSGAGKTRLHDIVKEELAHNVIVVNGDEYRRAHPNFQMIQQRYGVDAPAHTAKWAGQMTEALVDSRYHAACAGARRKKVLPASSSTYGNPPFRAEFAAAGLMDPAREEPHIILRNSVHFD